MSARGVPNEIQLKHHLIMDDTFFVGSPFGGVRVCEQLVCETGFLLELSVHRTVSG